MDMVVLMSSQSCQEKESSKGFHGGAHHGDGCITRLRCEKKEEKMARPRATRGGVPRKFNLQRFAAIINLRFSAAASQWKKQGHSSIIALITMKIAAAAVLTLLPVVACFAPPQQVRSTQRTTSLSSTIEAPPERVAPDAGYVPEWEDRPGLTPEEFMESDMSKPDLSGMWECPLTRWDYKG